MHNINHWNHCQLWAHEQQKCWHEWWHKVTLKF